MGALRFAEPDGSRSEAPMTATETRKIAEGRRARHSGEMTWSDSGNWAGTRGVLRAAIDAVRAELEFADLRPNMQMRDSGGLACCRERR